MKRSEMIEKISSMLLQFKMEYIPQDCDTNAERMLNWIEESGMLPPPEYHEQDREAKVHCNNAKRWMKWEPEDDLS